MTPRTAAHQASLSITNSQSLLKLMSITSVMPSSHLIFCHPLLLLSSIFPSIRVFSIESALHIKLPQYWSFSFNISPSNEYSGLIIKRATKGSSTLDVLFIFFFSLISTDDSEMDENYLKFSHFTQETSTLLLLSFTLLHLLKSKNLNHINITICMQN